MSLICNISPLQAMNLSILSLMVSPLLIFKWLITILMVLSSEKLIAFFIMFPFKEIVVVSIWFLYDAFNSLGLIEIG